MTLVWSFWSCHFGGDSSKAIKKPHCSGQKEKFPETINKLPWIRQRTPEACFQPSFPNQRSRGSWCDCNSPSGYFAGNEALAQTARRKLTMSEQFAQSPILSAHVLSAFVRFAVVSGEVVWCPFGLRRGAAF